MPGLDFQCKLPLHSSCTGYAVEYAVDDIGNKIENNNQAGKDKGDRLY